MRLSPSVVAKTYSVRVLENFHRLETLALARKPSAAIAKCGHHTLWVGRHRCRSNRAELAVQPDQKGRASSREIGWISGRIAQIVAYRRLEMRARPSTLQGFVLRWSETESSQPITGWECDCPPPWWLKPILYGYWRIFIVWKRLPWQGNRPPRLRNVVTILFG